MDLILRLRVLAMILLLPVSVWAQTGDSISDSSLTIEAIEAKIQEFGTRGDVPSETVAIYQLTLSNLKRQREFALAAEEFEASRLSAPERLAKLREELDSAAALPEPSIDADTSLQDLQAKLISKEGELAAARGELSSLEAEPQRRAQRRTSIPQEIQALREKLSSASELPTIPADATTTQRETLEAEQALLLSQRLAAESQIQSLDNERASIDARSSLLTARRDASVKKVERLRSQVELLRKRVEDLQKKKAEADASDARKAAREAIPALSDLAQENADLAEKRSGETGLVFRMSELKRSIQSMEQRQREVEERYQSLRQKVETVGLNNAIGLILRKEQSGLPNLVRHYQALEAREALLPQVQLEVLELQDERDSLADNFDERLEEVTSKLPAGLAGPEHEEAKAEARRLLENRVQLTQQLLAETEDYMAALVLADTAERFLIKESEAFSRYITERLLWIRSTSPVHPKMLSEAGKGFTWLFKPSNWQAAMVTAWQQFNSHPLIGLLFLIVLGGLFAARHYLLLRLKHAGIQAGKRGSHTFLPTIRALLFTGLLALPIPLLILFLSRLLKAGAGENSFVSSLGAGLLGSLYVIVPLEIFRQTFRRSGLAEAHLGWPESAVRALHRRFGILNPSLLFVAVLGYLIGAQPVATWADTVGTWLTLLALVVISWICWVSLRPEGSVLRDYLRDSESMRKQIVMIWRPILALIPIVLIFLALFGWAYGALPMAERYVFSLLFVMAMIIVQSILLRGILVLRRRIRLAQIDKKRSEIRKTLVEKESREQVNEQQREVASEIDAVAAGEQASSFIRILGVIVIAFGVWNIWSPVLPGLNLLNRVELWHTTPVSIPGAVNLTSGLPGTNVTNSPVNTASVMLTDGTVTLADLIGMFLTFGLTFLAIRNIPGLLEITVLRQLKLEPGVRFAVVTFVRYVLVMIGLVYGFGLIEIGWEKVQWLAAAVTVGLGFGLQEIFANFVSGIIILWERPMRIGDIVTVGDMSGTVSQIRMRATIITDYDNREFLVPNKEFVTGRLINWTLSSPVTRINIDVGVAYGSDTALAMKIMKEIADENQHLVKDPEPRAVFNNFGSSSLDLRLYGHLPSRSVYWDAMTSLRSEIDRRFKEAEIIIAFPQLDVHLDLPEGTPLPSTTLPEKGKESPST